MKKLYLNTRIEEIRRRLRPLAVKDSITIYDGGLLPLKTLRLWYRAARSMDIRVSIKTSPENTKLWRVQ